MPTERDFNQAVILAMLDRAAQGGQTVGDDLDSIAEYAQSQRRTKSVQARAHIFAGPVNRLKQYLHKGGQPSGPRTATPKPSGPHAGKPCKPGLSAARTGCIPKKKPGAGGGDKKTTPEGRAIMADAIHSHISKLLAGGEITATQVNMVKDALLKLTVSEITALKKKLGLKASGLKAELAQKIAERALAGKKPKTEEGEADGGQTGEPPSEGWWEDDEPADEGSGADAGEDEGAGGELAPEVGGSGDETVGGEGADDDQPTGEETPEDVPTLKELKAKKQRISKKLKQYASEFRKSGNVKQAEWMDDFRTQIESLGVEAAMEALGEEKEIRDENDKIQYVGAYDDLVLGADKDSKFIKQYLEKSGIILAGATIDPNLAVISSWSKKNLEAEKRTVPEAPGNYIPTDQTFANKLEESKHLPGLESSEDIHKIVGSQVTHFTPDVIAKLDERFGKGKWIVKSYGEEAFAGFGIFFPQRVKQIKIAAQSLMRDARAGLKAGGYKLLKGKGGSVVGVSKGGKQFKIGTEEFAKLGKKTQRLTRQAVQASHAANGAALPLSPEDSLKNDYGISFTRDEDGVPDGVVNSDGKEYKFDDPKYKDIADIDVGAAGYAIERAKEADEWRRQGYSNEPKFMVQPAFEAVGVSDYDRAMGNTWETAKEGRVHVTVQNGKAKAVPFATLVGRGDDLPAVFHSDDTREMEKAVEDAINQLPESERTGQIYAPDVMKTKDGWKVIELNPSAVGGGSDWLGRNPFVIDAVVSQLTNREPQHVRFVRDLLKSEGVGKGKKPKLPEGGGKFPAKPVSHLPQKGPAGTTAAAPKLTPAERQSAKKKLGDKYWGNKETQPYYRPGPNPTVDNVITRDGPDGKEVLLIKRKDGTVEGGKWALPGGFHDTNAKKGEPWKPGHETAQQAALRELAEETGLDAKALADHMKEVGEYEGGGRDPRDNDEAWSKSNAFSLHLPPELAQQAVAGQDDASDAKWVPVSQLKPSEMAFDHGKIFQDATGKKKEVPAVVIKGKPHEGQPCKPGLTTARDGCIARHGSVGRTQSGSYAPSGKPGAIYTVKYGSLSARYAIYTNKKINGPSIPLPNYKQKDDHSCGFVAALTVGRFFNTGLTAVEVLKAVRPTKSGGIDGGSLAEALKKIGVEAEFRSDLTIKRLRAKVEEGTPVLLTVYPEGWSSDHWVAVQGFDDERIYLTNYKSLPLPQFKKEWFEVGDGLVCKQTKIMTELEHTPPGPQNHLPTGKKRSIGAEQS
jgi:ADP-ribose pyrophosphatase YjhB (NUDIX family)